MNAMVGVSAVWHGAATVPPQGVPLVADTRVFFGGLCKRFIA
jgi:hypothetical protein